MRVGEGDEGAHDDADLREVPAADVLGIELELRRIVGVVSARVEHRSPGEPLAISVAIVGSTVGVADAALAAARPYFEGSVEVDVIEVAPPGVAQAGPAQERVRLLGVYAAPEQNRVEVHLAHGDRQAVGRSADRRLIGVARATMGALRSLGANLPFEIEAITRLGPGGADPVLVRLTAADTGSTRLGVVAAEDGHQATVRALLHALNRHLERAFAPDGPGGEADEEGVPALAG